MTSNCLDLYGFKSSFKRVRSDTKASEVCIMESTKHESNGLLYTNAVANDNAWHETQINKKTLLQEKIDEYVSGFTLHGLTKVFTSVYKFESLFWLTMLLSGILVSAYVTEGLLQKYLRYDVYTDIKFKVTDKNYFPAVTICEKEHLYRAYYAYCGHLASHTRSDEPCKNKGPILHGVNITTDNSTWWSNGLINITKCVTWGSKKCTTSQHFVSLERYDHACVEWNYNGHMYDVYSHVDIEFHFLNNTRFLGNQDIIFLAHDPEVSELDLTKAISIEPKSYDINIDKSLVKRLPSPFPSKCSDGKHGDIFPGKYTRRNCMESSNYIGMYKECGDTIDYARMFIPEDVKRKYSRNLTVSEVSRCLYQYGTRLANSSASKCPFPCTILDLNTLVSSRSYFPGNPKIYTKTYTLGVQYINVDSYRVIEEKKLYSAYQMACEIGGLIGLLIGSSLLSGIEIIVCIILYAAKKLKEKMK